MFKECGIVKVQQNPRNLYINMPKNVIENSNLKKGQRVLVEVVDKSTIVIKIGEDKDE